VPLAAGQKQARPYFPSSKKGSFDPRRGISSRLTGLCSILSAEAEVPFVSVTRLRVRSIFYLPQFIVWALRSSRQARRAEGFLGGRLLHEARSAFWTVTVWRDDAAMNSYRTQGAHRGAMPKLLDWCDEASVAHWTQETLELPDWSDAHQRMSKEGRPSKVKHPSAAHVAHQIPAPRPGRLQSTLEPTRSSH
jgi:hypothetical protein